MRFTVAPEIWCLKYANMYGVLSCSARRNAGRDSAFAGHEVKRPEDKEERKRWTGPFRRGIIKDEITDKNGSRPAAGCDRKAGLSTDR